MQEHWASFWEHVDDLRQTLLKSLIIVSVGFIVVLGFYQPLMQFLTHASMEPVASNLLQRRVERIRVINQTARDQQFELPSGAWIISDQLSDNPLGQSRHYRLAPGQSLLYEQVIHSPFLIMGPLEGLLLVFKVCFWVSMALTAPFWGWVWLQFILPGLKAQERAILLPFLLCSAISLGLGVVLAYTVTLPVANQYLMLFNGSIGQNAWTLTHYVDYVLLLCLGHAIAAELGLLLLLLVHFRLLSPEWLIAKRRYMIVVAFILGALLTPPDVLTQLLLAIPLMGLYEIAICYAKWRKRQVRIKVLD
jgi:sec-independent protein translocase protein TatC